jgi:YD repeat-containing protein
VVQAPPGTAPVVDDLSFSYDLQGRLLTAFNPSSQGITQTYDGLGRMDTRTALGRQLGYQYDLAGRRTRLTYPDNFYVTYSYTNLNELKSITDSIGTVLATYSYDGMGVRTGLMRGPDVAMTIYVPDAVKRLQQLKQEDPFLCDDAQRQQLCEWADVQVRV